MLVAPDRIQENVVKDPAKPGFERAGGIITIPVLERPGERLLHQILGVLVVAAQTQRKIVGLVGAPLKQRLVVRRFFRGARSWRVLTGGHVSLPSGSFTSPVVDS